MFPQIHITDHQIVRFWNDKFVERKSIEKGNKKIEFDLVKNKKIISIYSKNLLKDPAFIFIQGQILDVEDKITIQAKPMLKKIILWNCIGVIVISILQLKNSIILPIIFLLIFSTIILFQLNQINNASSEMENILKEYGQ